MVMTTTTTTMMVNKRKDGPVCVPANVDQIQLLKTTMFHPVTLIHSHACLEYRRQSLSFAKDLFEIIR